MKIISSGIFCKLLANLFIHCDWILLLKGFSMCKRSSWWRISVWRSFCWGAALVICFGKPLQRKCFLAVDVSCVITSADKLFWIRQIMAAPMGSRMLSDELHFDTFSAPSWFHFLPVASVCLYCDLSFTSLHLLPLLSQHVLSPCLLHIPSVAGSVPLPPHMLWCPPLPTFPLNTPWSPCWHLQSKPQWDWTRLWKSMSSIASPDVLELKGSHECSLVIC